MARATLEVVTHDYEMQRQLVLLLIIQALGRNDDKHLDQTCSLLDAFRADSALPLLGRENCEEPHVVRAALRIQAIDSADQVINEGQARADLNPVVASLRASVAHATGLRDNDIAELRSAVRNLTEGPRPLALASALDDLGAMSARQDGRDEAVDALGRALELYAGCGAS
jgi:hypothetical protein